MKKNVFSWNEAKTVAFETPASTLKLQLHLWKKAGEIVGLRRGVYAFAGEVPQTAEILSALYPPAYVSLESALSMYGVIPDVPFAVTSVTIRPTRNFQTPCGRFGFRHIPQEGFIGFDPKTLIATFEKAVVDYLYIHRRTLVTSPETFKNLRWQNLGKFNFRKARQFANLFKSPEVSNLLEEVKKYATTFDAD